MSFEQEMLRMLRTEQEVEDEATRKLKNKAAEQAKREFEYIKRGLLREAHNGHYELVNGRKIVRYMDKMFPYRDFFVYDVEDTSIHRKKTFFYSGPLYEFHNIVRISVNNDQKRKMFMEELHRLCKEEEIHIELCMKNEKNGNVVVPPCTLYDDYSFNRGGSGMGTWDVYIKATYAF